MFRHKTFSLLLIVAIVASDSSSVEAAEALSQRPVMAVAQLGPGLSIPMPSIPQSAFRGPSGGSMLLPSPPLNRPGINSQEIDWVVSSRCSRQDWDEPGSNGLMVHRRVGGGAMHRSSMNALRAEIDPSLPTAVFVHGSYVDFEWFVKESQATSKWLRSCRCGKPLQIIHFTWPSDENARYLPCSVRDLTNRAEFNGFYLARLLGCIPVDGRCGGHLTVIGHSHGGLITTAAMHLLAGGSAQGHTSRSRLQWKANVVLAAPAIDRDWLAPRRTSRSFMSMNQICDRGRYDRAMNCVNRMLILSNRHDIALKLYPARRLFAKQALGRTGLWQRDRDQMGSAGCRIRDVDVSNILGCKHIWPYYLASQHIACTVSPYVFQ